MGSNMEECFKIIDVKSAQDTSARSAAKQAWGTSKVARWSSEKVEIDQIARIHQKRASNRGRDLTRHMNRSGLMLGCPITWIKGVS